MKKRVLILCTGNSCRSQMAEALWRNMAGDLWDVSSAGSQPAGCVHPLAVAAMREVGIDISAARSKHVNEFRNEQFDLVVTVCDNARASCPTLPGATATLYWPIDDPVAVRGADDDRRRACRIARSQLAEQIRRYIRP